jgi:tetratricopeptide (TPR) repeat protein
MDSGQWDKAERELKKCMDIDRNNTMTLRYMQEVRQVLTPDDSARQPIKHKKEESLRYQSDNEIIIQPLNVKEQKSSGVSSLINIAIGLVIGLAAMYFLVMPARISNVNQEAQNRIAEIGNQLDSKNVTIQTLETQLETLQSENNTLNSEIDGYVGENGTLDTLDGLVSAASTYIKTGDFVQTGADLEAIAENVNLDETSDAFRDLYDTLLETIGPELAKTYFNDGYAAYRTQDYNTAIEMLTKAVYYDATNRDALYNLAMAYRANGNDDEAVAAFTKYIELFPQTDRAGSSQRYINEIQASAN